MSEDDKRKVRETVYWWMAQTMPDARPYLQFKYTRKAILAIRAISDAGARKQVEGT